MTSLFLFIKDEINNVFHQHCCTDLPQPISLEKKNEITVEDCDNIQDDWPALNMSYNSKALYKLTIYHTYARLY